MCLCYIRPDETRLHYVQRVNKRNGVKGIVDVATCALEKLSKSRDGCRVRQDRSVVATISVGAIHGRRRRLEIPRGIPTGFLGLGSPRLASVLSRPVQKPTSNSQRGCGTEAKAIVFTSFYIVFFFSFFFFCNKCSRRRATRVPRRSRGSFYSSLLSRLSFSRNYQIRGLAAFSVAGFLLRISINVSKGIKNVSKGSLSVEKSEVND